MVDAPAELTVSEPRRPAAAQRGWVVDVIRCSDRKILAEVEVTPALLPPRANAKGKIVWRLPASDGEAPRLGLADERKVLAEYRLRRKAKKEVNRGASQVATKERVKEDKRAAWAARTLQRTVRGKQCRAQMAGRAAALRRDQAARRGAAPPAAAAPPRSPAPLPPAHAAAPRGPAPPPPGLRPPPGLPPGLQAAPPAQAAAPVATAAAPLRTTHEATEEAHARRQMEEAHARRQDLVAMDARRQADTAMGSRPPRSAAEHRYQPAAPPAFLHERPPEAAPAPLDAFFAQPAAGGGQLATLVEVRRALAAQKLADAANEKQKWLAQWQLNALFKLDDMAEAAWRDHCAAPPDVAHRQLFAPRDSQPPRQPSATRGGLFAHAPPAAAGGESRGGLFAPAAPHVPAPTPPPALPPAAAPPTLAPPQDDARPALPQAAPPGFSPPGFSSPPRPPATPTRPHHHAQLETPQAEAKPTLFASLFGFGPTLFVDDAPRNE
ncbi:hypothetical protein M885DRAFT_584015 [Pelagophyceae sp. CCMP2097]|nr:hypothetical protein M885DRAFT_584015 [Pelagophyceae sp. CCMP2097]